MSLKQVNAITVLVAASLAMPVHAQQIAYQADNYTVTHVESQVCTMETKTPRGSTIQIGSDERDSEWNTLTFARQGFPKIGNSQLLMIQFEFDNASKPLRFMATGYQPENPGAAGLLVYIDAGLIKQWGKGKQVAMRIEDKKRTIIETISLTGSAEAVRQLSACVHPDYSPTVAPAPPVSSAPLVPVATPPEGFAIKCDTRKGVSTYYLGKTAIGKGPECGEGWEPFIADEKTFPHQRKIVLVQRGGGGTSSTGSIIMIGGAKPTVIPIDYMLEFGELETDTQVTVIQQGVMDANGPPCVQAIAVTLNWKTGATTERTVSSEGACG